MRTSNQLSQQIKKPLINISTKFYLMLKGNGINIKYSDLFMLDGSLNRDKILGKMRAENPFYSLNIGSSTSHFITRYDDVAELLNNSNLRTGGVSAIIKDAPQREQDELKDLVKILESSFPELTLDRHDQLKKVLMKYFLPATIKNLRVRIEKITCDLINKASKSNDIDIVSSFSYALPALVIAEIMGVPEEDRNKFIEWCPDLCHIFRPYNFKGFKRAQKSFVDMTDYCEKLMKSRTENPQDDLLTVLNEAIRSGDLHKSEALFNCAMLLFAGHDNTSSLLPMAIKTLCEHPEQLNALIKKPELIQGAVAELVRYCGTVIWLHRTVSSDFEFNQHTIKKGDAVYLGTHSANCDSEHFSSPHTFDIFRKSKKRNFGFGHGANFCLGATLAKMELEVAITEIIKQFPNMTLNSEQIEYHRYQLLLSHITKLPVKLNPI